MTYSVKFNENAPLVDLIAEIRRLNQTIRDYTRSTLRASMDLGDTLAWARSRAKARQWHAWRREHCSEISKRQDGICRQLAAARPIIERELANNPDLSIRGALKLISTPKDPPKPKPAVLEKWRGLSADEIRSGLAADSVDTFLEKYMPPTWRDELADKVARVKHKTARDRGLSARLREHIEKHPDDSLSKYVRNQAIDPQHLVVHVGAIDAPSKRRAPLVDHRCTVIPLHDAVH